MARSIRFARVAMAAAILFLATAALAQDLSQRGREFFLRTERGSHFFWKRRADLPEARSDMGVVTDHARGMVYLVGGCAADSDPDCPLSSNGVWEYNPATDEYRDLPPFNFRRLRHGSAAIGNQLYVFGGIKDKTHEETPTEVLDLNSGTWTVHPGGPLTNLSDFTTFVLNNQIYIAGGYHQPDYVPQNATYHYNTATNVWTKVAELNEARGDCASSVILDKAYIIGGWTTYDNWNETVIPIDSMEVFDPATHSMTMHVGDRLKPGRGDAAMCSIRGRLFIFGGENPSLNSLDEVEVLSLDNNSPESTDWHYAGELPDDRFRLGCASLHANSIHLFGGQTFLTSGNNITNLTTTTEVYEFIEQRIFEDLEARVETPVFASGTSTAARVINTAGQQIQSMSRTPVRIGYRTIETSQAQNEFVGASTNFVPQDQMYIGDAPLPRAQYEQISGKGHVTLQIPLGLTPIVIIHSIKTARGVSRLEFDACGIAKIFSGGNYTWGEVALKGVDSSYQNAMVVPRRSSDNSSLTDIMINYLSRACPSEFKITGFLSVPVHSGAPTLSSSATITFAFSSMIPPGLKFGVAAIKNPSGIILTPETAFLETSLPATFKNVTLDNSGHDFLLASGESAYPIVAPLFAYIRRDQSLTAQTGALLKAFLRYLLSPAGQNLLGSFGHGKLNLYWLTIARAAVSDIRIAPDAVEYLLDQTAPEPQYSLQSTRESRLSFDQAVLAAAQVQLEELTRDKVGASFLSDIDSESTTAIAIAGLVFALFGFFLACYVACKIYRVGKDTPAQGIDRRNTADGNASIAGISAANSKFDGGEHIEVV